MNFLRKNPARLYGLAVALVAVLSDYVVFDHGKVLALVGAVLAMVTGEVVQRTEDVKTAEAAASDPDPELQGH